MIDWPSPLKFFSVSFRVGRQIIMRVLYKKSWYDFWCCLLLTVSWSSWGDCSVTCGQGKQTRSKICLLGPTLCLPSSLVGTETQDCNSSPCPTNSSLITAFATYTPTSYSISSTQNPTSSMYSPTSTSSPTQSQTSSITTSQPTVVIGNIFFILSHRGCRYSSMRISRTVKVRNEFHCTSICARDSKCVGFNLDGIDPSDSSQINEYLKCEILEKGYGSDISLSQVSEDCKNYERVTTWAHGKTTLQQEAQTFPRQGNNKNTWRPCWRIYQTTLITKIIICVRWTQDPWQLYESHTTAMLESALHCGIYMHQLSWSRSPKGIMGQVFLVSIFRAGTGKMLYLKGQLSWQWKNANPVTWARHWKSDTWSCLGHENLNNRCTYFEHNRTFVCVYEFQNTWAWIITVKINVKINTIVLPRRLNYSLRKKLWLYNIKIIS